jgi:hypothetical protein
MIAEGAQVSYVGDDDDLEVGDTGKVLSDAGMGSHVLWSTGKKSGEITLVHDIELVQTEGARISYDDSFESGLVSVAVREVYDLGGSVALLNALNDEGHLATFAQIAEEAMALVTSRIREDLSMVEVLSALDPDEGSEFVALATTALLRDAFSGDGEE